MAVIVPALKLPEPSLATIVEAVLALVALDVTVNVCAEPPLNVAEPDRPVPDVAKVNEFATEPAEPVVFWLSVGISAATIALNVGAPAAPLGAAKNVFAVWLAKLDGKTDKVPPRVIVPVVVIVPPVSVSPLTVPEVATEVTVPVVGVVHVGEADVPPEVNT